ncbi:HAD family hydrolase [Desulfosporosinus shakirovi]|uniref:HAD family hydrolase n=1 Tax=Desulfosporosinus shakirovi TaxID=2885154 RepID=UPI001E49D0AF|nr:HAD family hydrolase [Desulfosporosinus sp. SRJS8]MCB8817721.1 HAD family hydrolase [Desulfosporosinus sp. SRJS8]
MIQAIIFDIEGILSSLDTVKFVQNYLGILAPRFAHILSPDKFSKQFLKSMENVQKEPKPEQKVMQAFFEDFSKAAGQSVQTLKPIFEEFYTSDFPALRCLVKPNPQGVKVVENAIQQGFLTAIVSDPLMPLIAIQEQIRWTGLTPEQFKVIGTLDDFHYGKPHLGFFMETAEKLGVRSQSCLLVSTHISDLVCQELGMKVFLLGGSIETENRTDYVGQLDDLSRLISQGSL